MRWVLVTVAALVVYLAIGTAVYMRDVSNDWCYSGDRTFSWIEWGVYSSFWPVRSAFCD